MKQKLGRKLLSFLLTLAMVVGLMPGMGMTAYAASTTVTWNASDIVPEHLGDSSFTKDGITITAASCDFDQISFWGGGTFTTTLGNFTKIEISADYAGEVSGTGWSNDGWQSATWTGDAASVSFSGDIWGGGMTCDGGNLTIVFTIATVPVTGVTLDKTDAQTIDVGGKVAFTATVAPDGATDKTVKWSVGGTNASAVTLYSDSNCTQAVGADATSTLTVYAKGISAGSATVTATSNADGSKSASCAVTVNAAQTQTGELLTTITATSKEQANYSTANVATVSFSYTAGGSSAYLANWGWWGYGWTATVNAAEGYTITKCVFYDDANRTATDSEAPFVVETTEEDKTPQVNGTPILAYTSKGIKKIEVYGYATPTATHSVTITAGDHMTKTADSGDAEQTGLTGAMTDVVYTADNGYYYPTDYSVAEVSGIKVTRDSYTQITVSGTPTADAAIALTAPTAKTTPDAPTTAAAENCTTADNNDGKLTGVTTAMEYKKSDAADWTAGTGSDITGLVPGTYYVRVKATEMTNASTNQELTIKGFISYTVTFKVVNGKWNEGEGDAATADKTVTLTGHDGDTLKLTADQIPAVGTKPNDTYKAGSWNTTPSTDTAITAATTYTYTYAQKDSISQTVTFKVVNGKWDDDSTADKTVTLTGYEGDTLKLAADQIPAVGTKPNDTYKAGSWDVMPNTDTAITEATAYTYTYVAKEASVVTKAPEAKTLTYTGSAQELVTAGTATGGTMQYALGTKDAATQPYTTSIPTKTDAGTYYVWYKVKGDANHNDTVAQNVKVVIDKAAIAPTVTIAGWTYGETANDPGVTGNTGNGTVTYTYAAKDSTDFSETKPTAAGSYSVKASIEATDNYKAATTDAVDFIIAKATVTITPDDKTGKYLDALAGLTYTKTGMIYGEDNLNITLSTTATDTSNVGIYPITVSYTENANYNVTVNEGKYTITKTDLNVVASEYSGVYDGKAHGITVDVNDQQGTVYYATEELNKDNYKTAGSTTAPKRTDVGTTTVYYYVESANYEPNPIAGSKDIVITKAAPTVTAPTAKTPTYTGEAQALISAGSTEDGTIVYSLDGATYAETIPTGVNAGEYTAYYKVIGDKNHKDSEAGTVPMTIGKAEMADKTVPDAIEVISAGVKDETIDLKEYLQDGAALVSAEASGELADYITAGTLNGGIFTYSVAENNGGITGSILLTVSSTNYKDYAIKFNLASAKKITEVVVETKDVAETAVEAVEVPALEDFTEAQPEATVEVKMEVKLESEATVEQEIGTVILNKIKDTIAKAFGGVASTELKQEYLDVTITKSVNGDAPQEISDVNHVLEIAVNYDLTGKYNPVVTREHEGTVAQFTRLSSRPVAGSYRDGTYYVEGSGKNAKLYIYGRLFSVYTVAYTTTASYQVTFDDATGDEKQDSNVTQVVVATGTKVAKPTDPKRDGYDFDGWFLQGTNTKWNFDTAVTSDITLVAHWDEEDDDDDEVVATPAPVISTAPRSPKTNDGLMSYSFWLILAAAGLAVSGMAAKGRKKEQ